MLVDHSAVVLLKAWLQSGYIPAEYREYVVIAYKTMRIIGRISLPIFAFCIAEGFFYTKSKLGYFRRIFLFACLSEIPYDLAICGKIVKLNNQNVLFTFSLAIIMLMIFDKLEQMDNLRYFLMVVFAVVGYFLHSDYGVVGILFVGIFYLFREDRMHRYLFSGACMLLDPGQLLSLPFMASYSGEKGRNHKKLFYLFYPLHLMMLWCIKMYLFQ